MDALDTSLPRRAIIDFADLAEAEGEVATFQHYPRWRIKESNVVLGWLSWAPGKYTLRLPDGTEHMMRGPKESPGLQPRTRARRWAEKKCGAKKMRELLSRAKKPR